MKSIISLILFVCLLSSCGKTIFNATFEPDPLNGVPNTNQQTGTIHFNHSDTLVLVRRIPGLPNNKWVDITRRTSQTSITSLQCKVDTMRGAKSYHFSTFLYIPTGAGLASISFETFNQAESQLQGFLHIDFTTDNKIRLNDDDSKKFGSFTRDRPFILAVGFDTRTANPVATISISGAGASGTSTQPLLNIGAISDYHLFGQVRLWMGWPQTGHFYADNIVVSYN